MKTFVDTNEKEWKISLTVGSAKRVKSLLGINLLELEAGNPPLMTSLTIDVILLCDVIYALIKPQADERGISDEQFGQALGGEVIVKAQAAFAEELISFFRDLGRKDLAKAIETQQKVVKLAIERVGKRIDEINPQELVDSIHGGLSTKSPDSSE